MLAAVEAGFTRFRPVCMTALAMIIGMSPMALGLGEGGEQNAPLGRAVIGGLIFATVATLLFVPVVFSIIHGRHAAAPGQKARRPPSLERLMPDKNPDAGPDHGASAGTAAAFNAARAEALGQDCARRGGGRSRWWASAGGCGRPISTAAWTDDQAIPTVQIIKPETNMKGGVLNLPGDVQAFTTAPIYAQVSGYVRKWYFDIGATVKTGPAAGRTRHARSGGPGCSKPAPIWSTPRRRKSLSAATAKRWDALFAQGAVSRQDKDEKDADLAAKNAAVAAAQASLYSVASQENFRRLVAPFDGVVTSRAVDVGALVTVGNDATPPLFTVSDQSKLRIYVRVPQNYAAYIRPGMTVSFSVPQYPGRTFHATLVASAGAVASATGTVLVQFGMDNHDGALQPGSYAEVKFPLPRRRQRHPGARHRPDVPRRRHAGRHGGCQQPRQTQDHHDFRAILGAAVDVGSGISAEDRIIDNPADALQEGDEVRVAGK